GPASYPREVLRGERPKRVLVPFDRAKGTPSGKRPHQAGKPEPWAVRAFIPPPHGYEMKIYSKEGLSPVDSPSFVRIQFLARGRVTDTVVPEPTTLASLIWPWYRATMCLTMARPSPVPPAARLRPLSTR